MFRKNLCALVFAISSFGSAYATDVYKGALIPATAAKPNVVFGLDDSGSMDAEVMLPTNDGALWWNESTKLNGVTGTGWDGTGKFLFNSSGSSGYSWTKFFYLFPNGCSSATRTLCDSWGHYAVPPTPQFAALRSSSYNPLFYDTAVTYQPWVPATIDGSLRTFNDVSGTAAPSHPLYATADNLATTISSTASNTTFQALPGMVVPAGAQYYGNNRWNSVNTAFTVAPGSEYRVSIPYYRATFWYRQDCTVDGTNCVRAPDGNSLKRYEIKSGQTFPSGRAYAEELKNFANWYTYYRKRKFMLAASAGRVMDSLEGMRLGVVQFNNQRSPTMYDSDEPSPSANAKVIAGIFYSNPSSGGTPTRSTLRYIGEQFRTNKSIIQYSCQKNAAFIMSDGFASASAVTPPAYDSSKFGSGSPYQTTYAGTLADIALSYYTNNLRPDLPEGNVPSAEPTEVNPQNDGNSNLHLNTYAMTLGAKGTLWPAVSNAYTAGIVWPNPNVNASPTAVDDLWHATVNGRGQMFTAQTPAETAQSIQAALANILSSSGSQAAVAFSTVNLKTDEALGYVGSYTPIGWSGDISAFPVDIQTGAFKSTPLWSASKLLDARDSTTRAFSTFVGGSGVPFSSSANWTALIAAGAIVGTSADFVSYQKGNRQKEGSLYRPRSGLMGAVINAEPVSWLPDNVVYAVSNAGFLHALDKRTGKELWAHAPSFALEAMANWSKPNASFETILDGTPVVAKVSTAKTMLVGGRGTAGAGYYALDVSNPHGAYDGIAPAEQSDSTVALRAAWEFPSSSTPSDIVDALGLSVGKPAIVRTTRWGWVALVTSGYNTNLDGKGRVFVLDVNTGKLLDTLTTTKGSVGAEDAGLAKLSAFTEADGTVKDVYAGDLLGNMWKFNLETSTVTLLATLTNSANAPLPLTAAPELAVINGRRMVFIGSGRMLGTSDFTDTSVNTFFALWDDGAPLNPGWSASDSSKNVRKLLAPRLIQVAADGTRTATGKVATGDAAETCTGTTKSWEAGVCYSRPPVDWNIQKGWYVDLPAGEKAHTDPTVGLSVLSWTTNSPASSTCSSSSALYLADAASGLQLPDSAFVSTPTFYGTVFNTTLTARPVLTTLPSGRMAVTTHQSDNSTTSRLLNLGGLPSAGGYVKGKIAWKQVLR